MHSTGFLSVLLIPLAPSHLWVFARAVHTSKGISPLPFTCMPHAHPSRPQHRHHLLQEVSLAILLPQYSVWPLSWHQLHFCDWFFNCPSSAGLSIRGQGHIQYPSVEWINIETKGIWCYPEEPSPFPPAMVSNTRFWVYLHFSKIIHKYSLKSNVLGQLLKVNPLLLCESAPLIYTLGKHVLLESGLS